MNDRTIHGRNRTLSASVMLKAIADDLSQIKSDDRLTYAELGEVLGKSEDQAAKYCEGTAEMGILAYFRGKREWNGRLGGTINRMIAEARGETVDDRCKLTMIVLAAGVIAQALEDDDCMDAVEVRSHCKTLEAAYEQLGPRRCGSRPRRSGWRAEG